MLNKIRYSRFVYWLKGDLTIRGAIAHFILRRAAKHYYRGWLPWGDGENSMVYVETTTPDGRYHVKVTPRGPAA